MNKQIVFWPVRRRQYFNPARDYVCEMFESVEGAHADWQEGKDWMDALAADIPRRDFSYRQARKVLEYAQTASGLRPPKGGTSSPAGARWYARKILVEDDFGARGLVRRIIFIHVDVTGDIPDELLDPESVAPDDFRPKEEQPPRH